MIKEEVFLILAEGGSLSIERIRGRNGEKFIYHHGEFDPTDEGLGVNEKGGYDNFEQPFQLINSLYPWYSLHIETIHEDYRDYVLEELIKVLMRKGVSPDDLNYSKTDLEEKLQVKLIFGYAPLINGLQNILVENLIKFTEYEHNKYRENVNNPEYESKFVLKAKFETWLAGGQIFQYEQVKMSSDIVENLETIGKLEINGNTIIIKNEFDQILYAFSSDKFFVSTTPILSKSKSWYYKKI